MAKKNEKEAAETEKNKGGRPSLYKPEYCQMLIDHMSTGLSYNTFVVVAKVNLDTLYEWEKQHPEFSEAKKEAFAHAQSYWERLGQALVTGVTKGSAAAWIFNMKNRFKWTDRQDITSGGNEIPRPQVIIQIPKNGREKPE